ncbi:hypothetical protein POSPLADRAFT_1116620, partial [Postia placenta MAD-698-R-SB12]
KTYVKLGRDPCKWQAKVVHAILKEEKDVVCVAPTGPGKTLTFWMPLLFHQDGIQIVVTPLNILGNQNKMELELSQDIKDGVYHAIIVNPEELMKDNSAFEQLWKNINFTSRIISIVWDEAHCISIWSSFRTNYREAHRLRYLIPHVCFVLATVTLPNEIQDNVMRIL